MADTPVESIIDSLRTKDGKILNPKSLTKAIYDENGVRLDTRLENAVYVSNSIPTRVETVNADLLNKKDSSYYQNVAGVYNANCTYSENLYTLTLTDLDITLDKTVFTLRFIAPNDYQENSNFSFNGITYTPTDPSFILNQVVLINFNSDTSKCYFSSGSGGAKIASDISIDAISGLNADNVQTAIETLQTNKQNTGDYATNTALNTGLDGKLSLTGGSLTGNLSLGNNIITDLKSPTNNTDATNKLYIDTLINAINALTISINTISGLNANNVQAALEALQSGKQAIGDYATSSALNTAITTINTSIATKQDKITDTLTIGKMKITWNEAEQSLDYEVVT